jgi:hypothetical protein
LSFTRRSRFSYASDRAREAVMLLVDSVASSSRLTVDTRARRPFQVQPIPSAAAIISSVAGR